VAWQGWNDFVPNAPSQAERKPSKYGARRTVCDGITFDSQKEATRYAELKLLERMGAISGLQLQPRFPLNAWHGDHSQCPLVGEYRADFQYLDTASQAVVVEDVKGFRTQLYRWKKKHCEAQYGVRIVEI
jgi:hypothetical protein